MLIGLRHRAYKSCLHHNITFGERTPGCLEQVRENTEPGSALDFSLTLRAGLGRVGLPAL